MLSLVGVKVANKSWDLFSRFTFCSDMAEEIWNNFRRIIGLRKRYVLILLEDNFLIEEEEIANMEWREQERNLWWCLGTGGINVNSWFLKYVYYTHNFMYVYVHLYVCTYLCLCICMAICTFARVITFVYMCYVYMYMHAFIF